MFAQAIAPPSLPAAGARLRLAVMASHRAEELRAAAGVLAQSARAVGFDPRTTVAFDEPEEEGYEAEPVESYAAEQTARTTTSRSPGRPEPGPHVTAPTHGHVTAGDHGRVATRPGALVVVGLEVPLARPAHGTEPGLGDVLERRASRNAPVRIALGWVIDEAARSADPLHSPEG